MLGFSVGEGIKCVFLPHCICVATNGMNFGLSGSLLGEWLC